MDRGSHICSFEKVAIKLIEAVGEQERSCVG